MNIPKETKEFEVKLSWGSLIYDIFENLMVDTKGWSIHDAFANGQDSPIRLLTVAFEEDTTVLEWTHFRGG